MKILINVENVIVGIVDSAIMDENGLLTETGGMQMYYPRDLVVIEVESIPDDLKPMTHVYLNGSFVLNPSYVSPPKSQEELEQMVKQQSEKINQLENLVADLTEVVLMGV